ncbi:partial Serine/threonine-protein kinase PK-1, partial [Anaerolineae bacterium]
MVPTLRPPALKRSAGSGLQRRSESTLLMEGVQLGPDLRLIRRLGYGGMGKVWLAHHLGLSRQVALKVLHRSVHAERHHRERFEREAKAVGRLHHPGFIEALDFGDLVDGRKFLAMEYVEGRTLEDALREQGYLPWRTAARIGAEVAGALAFAHAQGVV